jgi:hypothetical protein
MKILILLSSRTEYLNKPEPKSKPNNVSVDGKRGYYLQLKHDVKKDKDRPQTFRALINNNAEEKKTTKL